MEYENKHICQKCGEGNKITVKSTDGGHISECVTKCSDENCENLDYWSYGFFDKEPESTMGINTNNQSS